MPIPRAGSVGERRPDLSLAGFSPDLGRVLLATPHGGSGWDLGLALAAGHGRVWVVGETRSYDQPVGGVAAPGPTGAQHAAILAIDPP